MYPRERNTSIPTAEKMCIDTEELRQMLCSGRKTAVEIGTAAGARIKIGKRIMWNTKKICAYLDQISE